MAWTGNSTWNWTEKTSQSLWNWSPAGATVRVGHCFGFTSCAACLSAYLRPVGGPYFAHFALHCSLLASDCCVKKIYWVRIRQTQNQNLMEITFCIRCQPFSQHIRHYCSLGSRPVSALQMSTSRKGIPNTDITTSKKKYPSYCYRPNVERSANSVRAKMDGGRRC